MSCSLQHQTNSVDDLFHAIVQLNPMQKKFVESSWKNLTCAEQNELQLYLQYSLSTGLTIAEMAKAYDVIVKDTFKEQMYFKRHSRYRYSRYDEVARDVYQNPGYMNYYMVGLAISGYLWPNHVELHRFYQHWLTEDHTGHYLEIGPGHGYYFMQAARTGKFTHYQGVDISPSSVELTHNIMSSNIYGPFNNYSVDLADFFTWDQAQHYDFIVMAEVLEHVENPQDFLNRIRDLLTDDGKAYINTCINTPAIDHIFLYPNVESIQQQVKLAGLESIDQTVIPYANLTIEESMAQKLPVNVAMVLKKSEL